jgi:4-hydroxybenzoate polyprenyltransferase
MEYQVAAVVQVVIAFFAFSFAASAVYILNDLIDLQSDRQHATKRNRPFAAGKLSIFTGAQMAVGLSIASGLLATLLPLAFGVSLLVYAAITTAYSFWLKKKLLVDVFTLAGLYSLRVIAGAAAIGTDNSFWLLAFSLFFFLGLALVKRQVELAAAVSLPSHGALSGRGYRASDLDVISMSGLCAAFASVLVLALYIDSPAVRTHYDQPWLLWPLCPMTLYLTIRIWVLAYRGEMKEDPVQFLMMDWRSQLVIAAGAALVMLATIV